MALVDRQTPYEILVRFDEDGNLSGAHVRYLRTVILDGELLKAEPGPALPINLEGFPTSAVMDDVSKQAIANEVTLREEITLLNIRIADLEASISGQG